MIHNLARRWWLFLILIASALTVTLAQGRDISCCKFVGVPLRFVAMGQVSKHWAVKHFELRETPDATWGFIEVQNLADWPVTEARFYGEYFDAKGRFCFSLAFSLSSNVKHLNTPVQPGGIRTLRSLASSLTPAVAPAELRLYLVGQKMSTGQSLRGTRPSSMRVPPTISIPGGAPPTLSKLILGADQAPAHGSVRDLFLARIQFRGDGHVGKYGIIQATSGSPRRWLRGYLLAAKSVCASGAGFSEVRDVLLLGRAVAPGSASRDVRFLPRRSAWVSHYVATLTGDEVPLVVVLLFLPAPTRVKSLGSKAWHEVIPPPAPGEFSFLGVGTDWCPDVFKYRPSGVPGQVQREWRR